MFTLNGEPPSRPAGTGARVIPPQHGHVRHSALPGSPKGARSAGRFCHTGRAALDRPLSARLGNAHKRPPSRSPFRRQCRPAGGHRLCDRGCLGVVRHAWLSPAGWPLTLRRRQAGIVRGFTGPRAAPQHRQAASLGSAPLTRAPGSGRPSRRGLDDRGREAATRLRLESQFHRDRVKRFFSTSQPAVLITF